MTSLEQTCVKQPAGCGLNFYLTTSTILVLQQLWCTLILFVQLLIFNAQWLSIVISLGQPVHINPAGRNAHVGFMVIAGLGISIN